MILKFKMSKLSKDDKAELLARIDRIVSNFRQELPVRRLARKALTDDNAMHKFARITHETSVVRASTYSNIRPDQDIYVRHYFSSTDPRRPVLMRAAIRRRTADEIVKLWCRLARRTHYTCVDITTCERHVYRFVCRVESKRYRMGWTPHFIERHLMRWAGVTIGGDYNYVWVNGERKTVGREALNNLREMHNLVRLMGSP